MIMISVPPPCACSLSSLPFLITLSAVSAHLLIFFSLCVGSRGVSIEQYLDIDGSSVNQLKNSAKFPDQPDNFLIFPVFQPSNSYSM